MAGFRQLMSWFDRRRQLLLAGLVGWIVVVVVGSGRSPDTNWVGIPDLSDAATVVFFLAVLAGLASLVWILRSERTAVASERPRGQLALWVALAALLFLVASNPDIIERLQLVPEDANEEDGVDLTVSPSTDDDGSLPIVTAGRRELATIVLALGVGAGLWIWSRRRLGRYHGGAESEFSDLDQLAPVIDRAAEHLRLDGHPRTAVLNAYAFVEQALADHHGSYQRLPWETPSEHVRRALARLPVNAEPLVRLGELYQRARFSNHVITEADRSAALVDLERVHRDLQSSGSTNGDSPPAVVGGP